MYLAAGRFLNRFLYLVTSDYFCSSGGFVYCSALTELINVETHLKVFLVYSFYNVASIATPSSYVASHSSGFEQLPAGSSLK